MAETNTGQSYVTDPLQLAWNLQYTHVHRWEYKDTPAPVSPGRTKKIPTVYMATWEVVNGCANGCTNGF